MLLKLWVISHHIRGLKLRLSWGPSYMDPINLWSLHLGLFLRGITNSFLFKCKDIGGEYSTQNELVVEILIGSFSVQRYWWWITIAVGPTPPPRARWKVKE